MKKTVMLLFSLAALQVYSQCNCSGSSTSLPVGETGSVNLVLTQGKWTADLSGEFRDIDEGTMESTGHLHNPGGSTAETNMLDHSMIMTAGLRYGLTQRLTVSASLPLIELSGTASTSAGAGDLLVLANVQFFETSLISVAGIAGLKLPTGVRSGFGSETNMVIGTGSYDPLAGLNVLYQAGKPYWKASVVYKYSTPGFDKITYGNFFMHQLSFNCPLGPSCKSDSLLRTPTCILFGSIDGEMSSQGFTSPGNYISNYRRIRLVRESRGVSCVRHLEYPGILFHAGVPILQRHSKQYGLQGEDRHQ